MKRAYRLALILSILLVSLALDQTSKSIAQAKLASGPPIYLLGGTVLLAYAENPGAVLGLGASLPEHVRLLILEVMVALVVAVALWMAVFRKDLSPLQIASLALLASGGIGNLIDRLMNDGWVVDFIVLQAGNFTTGIFNLADVVVFAGAGLLVLSSFIGGPKPESEPADELSLE